MMAALKNALAAARHPLDIGDCMAKHKLDGGGELDIISMTGGFGSAVPFIEGSGQDRLLNFSKPANAAPLISVNFKIKSTADMFSTSFGIKQICKITKSEALYEGIKDINGSISYEAIGFIDITFLDIAPSSLTLLFNNENVATGAVASAQHAPFYSENPAFIKAGVERDLGIVDHPGGNFRLELQNAATDRPNFLSRVRKSSEFVTALVVIKADKSGKTISHTPLAGIRWRCDQFATLQWEGNNAAIAAQKYLATKISDLQTISTDAEFDILRNTSSTVADCIVQKFNDALFSASHKFRIQDYKNKTNKLTVINSKGIAYIQFPIIAN